MRFASNPDCDPVSLSSLQVILDPIHDPSLRVEPCMWTHVIRVSKNKTTLYYQTIILDIRYCSLLYCYCPDPGGISLCPRLSLICPYPWPTSLTSMIGRIGACYPRTIHEMSIRGFDVRGFLLYLFHTELVGSIVELSTGSSMRDFEGVEPKVIKNMSERWTPAIVYSYSATHILYEVCSVWGLLCVHNEYLDICTALESRWLAWMYTR